MKNIISISFFLIILFSCTTLKLSNSSNLYKIKRIEDCHNFYIIYAQRNDSLFKIISKDNLKENHSRIAVGGKYNLTLKVLFPNDSLLGVPVMSSLTVKGITISDKLVTIEKKYHYKLYISTNLFGLFLKQ